MWDAINNSLAKDRRFFYFISYVYYKDKNVVSSLLFYYDLSNQHILLLFISHPTHSFKDGPTWCLEVARTVLQHLASSTKFSEISSQISRKFITKSKYV